MSDNPNALLKDDLAADIFSAALENAYNSVMITTTQLDPPGPQIVYVNPAFTRMTGYEPEEVLGKTPRILQGPRTERAVLDRLRTDLEAGRPFRGEAINYRKDGSEYHLEWNISIVHAKDGRPKYYVAMQRDVTDYRRTQEALQQANERLEERVRQRTAELEQANKQLAAEIAAKEKVEVQLRRRAKESQTLAEVSAALNRTLDLRTLLQQIVDAAPKIMSHINRAVIHLFDENTQHLEPVAVMGNKAGPDVRQQQIRLRPGEGLAGRAFAQEEPLITANALKDPRYIAAENNEALQSVIALPIRSKNRVIGTLSVHSPQKAAFDKQDEALLHHLSDNAATAIENARLYEKERKQRQLAEMLAMATQNLNSFHLQEQVLSNLLLHLSSVLACQLCYVLLVEEDTAVLGQAHTKDENQFPRPDNLHISLDHADLTELIATRDTLVSGDMDPAGREEDSLYHSDWIRSRAVAPLSIGEFVIGFLVVECNQPYYFTQDIVQWLRTYAGQSAGALKNARLYEELEASLEKEKATRHQLVQSGKLAAMGRMVASVAHELNNPLQTIRNCLYLLQEEVGGNDYALEYVQMSLSEIRRLSDLVLQLREVYRPRDGKMKHMSVLEMLRDVRALVTPHLRQHQVQWEWPDNPIPPTLTIRGIPDQIKQVCLNISLNAIEVMQETRGVLRVNVTRKTADDKQMVGLVFADNGPGMSKQKRESLFDPFFTTKDTGMGLGLAICYDIVQHHHGRIDVDSTLGEGTRFIVWLPRTMTTAE